MVPTCVESHNLLASLASLSSSLRLCYQLLATALLANTLFLPLPFSMPLSPIRCLLRLPPSPSRAQTLISLFTYILSFEPSLSLRHAPSLRQCCLALSLFTLSCRHSSRSSSLVPSFQQSLHPSAVASSCRHVLVAPTPSPSSWSPPFSALPISFVPRLAIIVCAAHLHANIIA